VQALPLVQARLIVWPVMVAKELIAEALPKLMFGAVIVQSCSGCERGQ
jgi:hypothetical protein